MRQRLFTPGYKPTLLAMLVSAGSLPVMAATPSPSAAASPEAALTASQSGQTITVTATPDDSFKPGGDQTVPAYLEGQVAHGGRLGMLGEQKAMDVPFNVIGFTAKMIEDQQAKTIADVVRNDAGVQSVKGYGNFAESYRIRGFLLDGDDMTYGGMPGVVPRQVMDASLIDRVEIFKGANSLLNGAASSGVGGIINLEPKHAGELPQARIGVDYSSDAQIGTTVDAGRRFGDNDQFGVRVNVVQVKGKPAWMTRKSAPPPPQSVWTIAVTGYAPRWMLATKKRPFTTVCKASTSAASISFRQCHPILITTVRNGSTATWSRSLVWPGRSTISAIAGPPMPV